MASLSFITCPTCQKPFTPKTGQKFCSLLCVHASRRTRVPTTCEICRKVFLVKPSTLAYGEGRHCSHACQNESRRISDIATYLWSRVDTSVGPSQCWLFIGKATRYGKISFQKRTLSTHRLAYEITYGPIPMGEIIRHTCDVKQCCNPAHLITGTNTDNMRDAVERGQILKGEQNPNAKLTEAQVRRARRWAKLGMKQCDIARRLRVNRQTIHRVVCHKNWKHLN